MRNKLAKELHVQYKKVDSELQQKWRVNIKVKDETRKLKEKLSLLKNGKSMKLNRDADNDERTVLAKK